MSRTFGRFALAGLLVCGIACTKPAVHDKQSFDPLVTSKRAVEGKAHITDYRRSGQVEIPPAPKPEAEAAKTTSLTGGQDIPE
jgi:hypothetical protein